MPSKKLRGPILQSMSLIQPVYDGVSDLQSAYFPARRKLTVIFAGVISLALAAYAGFLLATQSFEGAAVMVTVTVGYLLIARHYLVAAQRIVQAGMDAKAEGRECTVCRGVGLAAVGDSANPALDAFLPHPPNTVIEGCTACPACGPVPAAALKGSRKLDKIMQAKVVYLLQLAQHQRWESESLGELEAALRNPVKLRAALAKASGSTSWVAFHAQNILRSTESAN